MVVRYGLVAAFGTAVTVMESVVSANAALMATVVTIIMSAPVAMINRFNMVHSSLPDALTVSDHLAQGREVLLSGPWIRSARRSTPPGDRGIRYQQRWRAPEGLDRAFRLSETR